MKKQESNEIKNHIHILNKIWETKSYPLDFRAIAGDLWFELSCKYLKSLQKTHEKNINIIVPEKIINLIVEMNKLLIQLDKLNFVLNKELKKPKK